MSIAFHHMGKIIFIFKVIIKINLKKLILLELLILIEHFNKNLQIHMKFLNHQMLQELQDTQFKIQITQVIFSYS